jgi:hypothetical protein
MQRYAVMPGRAHPEDGRLGGLLPGCGPRVEGERANGDLIVGLTYSWSHRLDLRPQEYVVVTPDDRIIPDEGIR